MNYSRDSIIIIDIIEKLIVIKNKESPARIIELGRVTAISLISKYKFRGQVTERAYYKIHIRPNYL